VYKDRIIADKLLCRTRAMQNARSARTGWTSYVAKKQTDTTLPGSRPGAAGPERSFKRFEQAQKMSEVQHSAQQQPDRWSLS
jgi:hypothetical protein